MSLGYRVTCYINGDRVRNVQELPDHLFCDETLDGAVDQIKQYLQTWIKAGGSKWRPGDRLRRITITVTGPVDHRTPEQRLADANSPEERFEILGRAAKSRFEAEEFEEALNFITELEEMLPSFEDHGFYWDADQSVQIVLGRLALREGDVEEAKRRLMEAGRGNGSPALNSFGPNMSLARDLLVVGEKQAVLDYFNACRKFWSMGADRLEEWEMYVKAGRVPDFGANLVY